VKKNESKNEESRHEAKKLDITEDQPVLSRHFGKRSEGFKAIR